MHCYHFVFLFLAISPSLATPVPGPSYIKAFDLAFKQFAEALSEEYFWNCTYKNGYRKVVIRGYTEACGLIGEGGKPNGGGKVDDNFLPAYKYAIKAGYAWQQIDTYLYPCTNTPDKTTPPCRSADAQLNQFTSYLDQWKIQVNTIWLDIEQTEKVCNSWHMGNTSTNLQLAQEWITAIRKDSAKPGRTWRWGIYAPNSQQKWASLFGSGNVPIAPDLPFWAVDNGNGPDPSRISPLVGGWTHVAAVQWDTEIPGGPAIPAAPCYGSSVDLDSFDPASQPIVSSPTSTLGHFPSCKTTADGLRYRLCAYATESCPAMGQYAIGTLVDFTCKVTGEQIYGDWNTNAWGKTTNGYFVSLAYIDQSCAKEITTTCLS